MDGVGPSLIPDVAFAPETLELGPDEEGTLSLSLRLDPASYDAGALYAGKLHLAGASEVPIVADKLPDASEIRSQADRDKNLPHSGKGIYVLYISGSIEWIESTRFPDDLPVIGQDAPENLAKLRGLKSGIEGK